MNRVMRKFYLKAPVIATLLIFFCILFAVSSHAVESFNAKEETIKVGIVMYHSILDSDKKAGKYVITPELLESDLKFLRENGYNTVYVSDLMEWVKNGKALPEKPVVISFDDGYYNNLSYALPLLEKYGMKADISVIGRYTELYSNSSDKPNNNYSHLTWDDLKSISGNFEILNHSYDMHSDDSRMGMRKLPNESKNVFKEKVSADITKMQQLLLEKLGIECRCFTYPYGFLNEATETIIKELGFEASLSCYEHINELSHNPDCLFSLGRYNRPYGIPSEKFFENFDY